jgi:fluoroacetyl-CoA thioesterase
MKLGLQIGHTKSMEVIVTPEMFAQFAGEVVHHAYSTVSMVYHMEWVSRQIILPYLEDYEEGMGAAVSVKHIAPSIEGDILIVTAVTTRSEGNIVMTNVEVKNGGRLVGEGEVKQVILSKKKIEELLKKHT